MESFLKTKTCRVVSWITVTPIVKYQMVRLKVLSKNHLNQNTLKPIVNLNNHISRFQGI